jgi:hypothetical protein
MASSFDIGPAYQRILRRIEKKHPGYAERYAHARAPPVVKEPHEVEERAFRSLIVTSTVAGAPPCPIDPKGLMHPMLQPVPNGYQLCLVCDVNPAHKYCDDAVLRPPSPEP